MEKKLELIEPWKANEYSIVKNDEEIVYVGKNKELASLIAAAPELLAGLQMIFNLLEENDSEAKWYLRKHYDQINNAIKKAT